MKTKIFIYSFLLVLLLNCTKKSEVELIENNNVKETIHTSAEINLEESIVTMYVNSPEGLRVRNSPDINGERIGLLDDLTLVRVIKQDETTIDINGIKGKWTYIETENIQGWVFSGYLSSLKPLRTIKEINDYIRGDLQIAFRYGNLRDLFNTLKLDADNLAKGYEVVKESSRAHPDSTDGFWYYYTIEYGPYIFNLTSWNGPLSDDYQNDRYNFSLGGILINISNKNYLELFPYRAIEEYLTNDKFGRIGKIEENSLIYHIIDPFDAQENCNLIFENGFLKAIELFNYQG